MLNNSIEDFSEQMNKKYSYLHDFMHAWHGGGVVRGLDGVRGKMARMGTPGPARWHDQPIEAGTAGSILMPRPT